MKRWAHILIALLLAACLAAAQEPACQLRAKEAKDCSLCCALSGQNKFDSAKFAASKQCVCYTDQKEAAANERHKPRRP